MKRKILVACEYSGIVRNEFEKLGWDAWSCDIIDTEIPGNHYKCDVLEILNLGWDVLIGFPPCTYLTYAGNANWLDDGRAMKRIKAAEFFMQLYDSNIQHVCIENPQGIMNKIFRPPDQIIHPYFFGDGEMKRTCLWLKNLPLLQYSFTNTLFEKKTAVEKPVPNSFYIQKKTKKLKRTYFTNALIDNKFKSGHERSKTFPSIAKAMAEQWTNYLLNQK